MYIYKKNVLLIFAVLIATASFAQDREQTNDTIDTQVVNVVKPYTPKISDAFKIKEIPSLNDEETTSRKEVKYNIFSIPVASTFTPAKGKAAVVEKAKKEELYDNFLSFGAGTYTSLLGELYLNHAINRTESVGGYISHHSSQGGIDGVLIDDAFSNSKIRVDYAKKLRDYSWNVDLGYQHQVFNWYGLPQPLFNDANTDAIDPQHKFFAFDFGGEIEFDNSVIHEGRIRFRRFADDRDTGENHFVASTNFDFPVSGESVNATVKLDYLSGNFDRSYFSTDDIDYGNFTIGLIPSYELKQDDLTLNLGVSAYYLNDKDSGKNKFFIYPNITASYRLANDVLIAYGGIQGGLHQNTYQDFAKTNPFVSPTLFITPTDQQYDAFIGLKGKLSNNMSYNFRGSYKAANNQALFKSNPVLIDNDTDFQNGNSYGIAYDDMSTFSIFGELNVDVNRNFNLGVKAEYFTYNTDGQAEAWNLPDFKASLFLDYQIDEHWFAGANLYYVGERFDELQIIDPFLPSTSSLIALDSYFDANAHVGYRINDRWSVYAKANNIANQDYNRWLNYPVQGIQFLAGATYKFDF